MCKYAAIAKLRCGRGGVEEAACNLQEYQGHRPEGPPTWAVVQRSPEQGRRRRFIWSIADKARRACPMFDIDTNAAICIGGAGAAKYKAVSNTWDRRAAWQATGANWVRFDADLPKRQTL